MSGRLYPPETPRALADLCVPILGAGAGSVVLSLDRSECLGDVGEERSTSLIYVAVEARLNGGEGVESEPRDPRDDLDGVETWRELRALVRLPSMVCLMGISICSCTRNSVTVIGVNSPSVSAWH